MLCFVFRMTMLCCVFRMTMLCVFVQNEEVRDGYNAVGCFADCVAVAGLGKAAGMESNKSS